MKKITLQLLLISLILVAAWSCKKSFFNASSNDGSITDASAFQSKDDFDKALIGTYASLVGGNTGGSLWAEVPGWISQDWVENTLQPKPFLNFMSPANGPFLEYWTNLYKIVASANLVLD